MTKDYDERQLQIRGRIFQQGYAVTAVLLFTNAFLNRADIMWASGFYQNFLIAMIVMTFLSVRFHVNGVYFAKNFHKGMLIAIFGLCSLALLIMNATEIIRDGAVLAQGGGLTETGCSCIMGLLFLINTVFALRQTYKERVEKLDVKGGSYEN